MAHPSQSLPMPVELLAEVIKNLPLADQQSFSFTSRFNREVALPFIFAHLRYTSPITPKMRKIQGADKKIKGIIKKLELLSIYVPKEDININIIFQVLETLPNLCSFRFSQGLFLLRPADISQLLPVLRHAPLREFDLYFGGSSAVEGPPTTGLSGLEKLFIHWILRDNPHEPGSSFTHLYELIRPSLTTLVELRITRLTEQPLVDFDIRLLQPAGGTLQVLQWFVPNHDESILDIVPEILPNLVTLKVEWSNRPTWQSVLWKDSHIKALSKIQNLRDLTLSSDFEVAAGDKWTADEDYAWFVRSYGRRLKATQDVALACAKLQQCSWVQMGIDHRNSSLEHPFVVENRVSEGDTTRVVGGVKQYWMGRDQEDAYGRSVVKCKLEDLPGDIIGENDSPDF